MKPFLAALTLLTSHLTLASAAEPPRVAIVVGPDAPALDRLAAEEVAEHLRRLFDAKVETVTKSPADATNVILVGSPATNPAVKSAVGEAWPKLSAQGHILMTSRVNDRPALVLGGGSPVATFWAASELGHRWGVRTLLFDNLLPADIPAFSLDGFDVTMEPSFERRAWTLMDSSPAGWAAWGLADQKRLLRQLARLKFNRIVLPVEPWQPFVSWSFGGIEKQSALLWPDGPIKVDGDTAGRAAFKGAALFDNPDLAGKTAFADRTKAGVALLTGIIDQAHRLGMTAALAVSPFEFPKEFEGVVPGSEPSANHPNLAVTAAPPTAGGDAAILKAAGAQLRAYVDAYPAIDAIVVTLPFGSGLAGGGQAAWRDFQATGTIARDADLAALLRAARDRKGLLSGDDAAVVILLQLAALPTVRRLIENPGVTRRTSGTSVPIELAGIDPALAWLATRITPDGAATLFVPDALTAPGKAPASAARLTANLEWIDSLFGVLPAFHFKSTASTLKQLRGQKWGGFTVITAPGAGVDATALFAARAAFDGELTPEAAVRDLVDHVSGTGAADRVWKGFSRIEDALVGLDEGEGLADETQLIRRHAINAPLPGWWGDVRDAYLEAMNEMYRANTRAREGARDFTLYHARRFEAAWGFMTAMEAVRTAAIAKAAGDDEKRAAQIEAAIEAMYGALNAHAAVARDPGDRGVIAILNEHGYRRLQRELE